MSPTLPIHAIPSLSLEGHICKKILQEILRSRARCTPKSHAYRRLWKALDQAADVSQIISLADTTYLLLVNEDWPGPELARLEVFRAEFERTHGSARLMHLRFV